MKDRECEERVIAKLRLRRDGGRVKYGTSMERTDLNIVDWLNHAQEEALDLAIYLEKLKKLFLSEQANVAGAPPLIQTPANATLTSSKTEKAEMSNLNYWHGEYKARLRYMAEALDEAEIWVLHVTATSDGDLYTKAASSLQKIKSALQYKPASSKTSLREEKTQSLGEPGGTESK